MKMIDAGFAREVTNLFRHPGVHVKKFKLYIPRTWNAQLDDVLGEIVKRASKGYSYIEFAQVLQPTTIEELCKRGFMLELADCHCIIQW